MMTMIVRFLDKTVVPSLTGDASGNVSAGDAGLSSEGEGTWRRVSIALDLESSVCISSTVVVVVAISRADKKAQNLVESRNVD